MPLLSRRKENWSVMTLSCYLELLLYSLNQTWSLYMIDLKSLQNQFILVCAICLSKSTFFYFNSIFFIRFISGIFSVFAKYLFQMNFLRLRNPQIKKFLWPSTTSIVILRSLITITFIHWHKYIQEPVIKANSKINKSP